MGDQAGATADDGGCGTDQTGDRHQVDVAGAVAGGLVEGLAPTGEGRDAEDALAVADRGDGCDPGQVQAVCREQVDRGQLRQEHAGQSEGGGGEVVGARLLAAGEPCLRLERTREGGCELPRDGRETAAGLVDELGDPRGVGVLAEQLAQGGEPVGALAAEGQCELLTLVQAVGQSAASLGGGVVMGQRGGG